jgi:LysM repeat protein
MRQGLWKIGILLVVVAVLLGGLAGCSRSAQVREAEETEMSATTEVEVSLGGEVGTPTPGQTVVSAVTSSLPTSTTVVEMQPTMEPTGEAIAADLPATPTEAAAAAEPPASEPSTSSTEGEVVVHTVKRGETLSSIAQEYGTTVKAIKEANDMGDSSTIFSGQELQIPTSGDTSTKSTGKSKSSTSSTSGGCRYRHKVKKGEWVWQIARDYGVSPYKILSANNLTIKKANKINPGKVLCIP